MLGKSVRMAVSVAALVALFVSPASAAGSKYPPDATCQTNGVVRSIVYLGGVTYLGGDFTQVTPAGIALGGTGTVTRNYLAACSESTGAILPWNPGANGRVMSLANAGSTIYVGGHFTTLAGQSRKNIGAVTTTGAATSFNPTAAGEVFVVRVGPNGNIFAGGSFSKLAGDRRPGDRLRMSAAVPAAGVHDRLLGLDRLLRRPLRAGQRRLAE